MTCRTLMIIAACAALVACARPAQSAQSVEVYTYRGIYVWTDPDTRCEYLVFNGYRRGGITPRLDRSGSQICARGVQ